MARSGRFANHLLIAVDDTHVAVQSPWPWLNQTEPVRQPRACSVWLVKFAQSLPGR